MQGLICEDGWEAKCVRLTRGGPSTEQGRGLGASPRCDPHAQFPWKWHQLTREDRAQIVTGTGPKSVRGERGASPEIASPSGATFISCCPGTGSGGAAGTLLQGHSKSKHKCFKNPVLSVHPGYSFHLTCLWDTSAWGLARESKPPAHWRSLRSPILPFLHLPPFLAATGLQTPCPSSAFS